ncbi:PfkB family carbohydrate kinase [Vreelandella sp. EE22]
MSHPRLIHTGQVIVDLVMPIDRLPAPGGDTLAKAATFEVGGGFNVMAAARRDGMKVVYTGGHGQGRFGDMARAAMARENIECVALVDESLDTGFCVALIDEAAERTFITHIGAEVRNREALARVTPGPSDYVLVSGYTLSHEAPAKELTEWLCGLADQVSVVFDPGPLVKALSPERLSKILKRTTLMTCNAGEACALTGTARLEEALEELPFKTGASLVVVRDGPGGCHLLTQGCRRHVAGFPAKAIDTNGAGDAHTGVLVAALSRGLTPEEAALRANAAAALAVSRFGPATAPLGQEIDDFIR